MSNLSFSIRAVIFLIIFFSIQICGYGQVQKMKSFWDFMPSNGKNRAEVLLVGSFHFGYPGQDAHKTSEEDKIDILSEEKQKEVQELSDYIARFKPTKIMVETGANTGYLMRRYER